MASSPHNSYPSIIGLEVFIPSSLINAYDNSNILFLILQNTSTPSTGYVQPPGNFPPVLQDLHLRSYIHMTRVL